MVGDGSSATSALNPSLVEELAVDSQALTLSPTLDYMLLKTVHPTELFSLQTLSWPGSGRPTKQAKTLTHQGWGGESQLWRFVSQKVTEILLYDKCSPNICSIKINEWTSPGAWNKDDQLFPTYKYSWKDIHLYFGSILTYFSTITADIEVNVILTPDTKEWHWI